MARSYLGWLSGIAICAGVLAVLWPSEAGSPEEKAALGEGRTVITYWDRHSGHEHAARASLMDEYNRTQGRIDGVYVRALPIGYDVSMEKLLTSVAGGAPPDLCGMDGTILVQLAARGCFTPLDDFLASDPHLQKEAFFPFMWESVRINGHSYGVPTTTDTYCLLWNKAAFRRAGLDPERPPQTLEELVDYAARLTIQDGSGIKQIGFLPWLSWDHSYMWGAMFGGEWYDEATGQFVASRDPAIVRSLEWQASFAIDPRSTTQPPHALDPAKVMTFSKSFGAYMSANNPFYTGKVAMIVEGEWQCTFIPIYAPDLEWGVAPIPTPEGAEPIAYSATCIADCVPAGCPHPDAAFKFLRWFHTPRPDGRPSPASDYNYAIHNIPVRPREAMQARFLEDPKFRVFVEVLMTRRVVSAPTIPETQFMFDYLDLQRERVTLRKTTPQQALDDFDAKVNTQLAETRAFLARVGRRGASS